MVRVLTHQVLLPSAPAWFCSGNLAVFAPDSDFNAIGRELSPLLERHDLRRLRTITGRYEHRWSFRLFW